MFFSKLLQFDCNNVCATQGDIAGFKNLFRNTADLFPNVKYILKFSTSEFKTTWRTEVSLSDVSRYFVPEKVCDVKWYRVSEHKTFFMEMKHRKYQRKIRC